MKLFACQNCGQLVHFENVSCMNCGMPLGYLPGAQTLNALNLESDGSRTPVKGDGSHWRPCANESALGCNWMVPAESDAAYCEACALNDTVPDLSVPGNLEHWQAIEFAKRRVIYTLDRLRLPLVSPVGAHTPLRFKFLADVEGQDPVLTGHDDGLIVLNIAEADSAERERRRAELGEPYRTLLGHFRHEVGHYYWDMLVRDSGREEACRALFGDERADYGAALQEHYNNGTPAGWEYNYVSAYATMHPWEDFAETWTHYLHMIDTLDTAANFGVVVNPVVSDAPEVNTEVEFDPYNARSIDQLIDAWVPLTVALNSLNRSMGQPDLYPFSLSPAVVEKLRFIHMLVQEGPLGAGTGASDAAA
ncbi:zinc-binding metallopeptidase family protein [Amaricoccus solimangrovi]|uniref:Zinc-ribbon domain-containing protein n=1 Tax=Amaricoccus solimangrovi TaxID=2589815 RepID=A0A501WWB5_9RHOB|nr:putative zinc-binding peptidase [Amaricoccus solimangrovi]TPE50176.1 hypothetical protein FJM51_12385 [Amaricoccus solimangrovi]